MQKQIMLAQEVRLHLPQNRSAMLAYANIADENNPVDYEIENTSEMIHDSSPMATPITPKVTAKPLPPMNTDQKRRKLEETKLSEIDEHMVLFAQRQRERDDELKRQIEKEERFFLL